MSELPSEERQVADDQPTDAGMASESPLAQTDPASNVRPLRVWPAVLPVICLWGVQFAPALVDEVSLLLVTALFLGPALFALLILLWWAFVSRASLGEKALGLFGLAVIGIIVAVLADRSIQGYGFIISPVPWGVGAFAAGLICTARMRSIGRTWLALLAALIGFGYWDLVRAEEIYGDFQSTRSWRWQPSAEDRTQERLAARAAAPPRSTLAEFTGQPFDVPEWPEFRGPNRDGVVSGVVLAEDWQVSPPREIWRIPIGPGWSSFCVAGRRLFTQEQRGDYEAIVCYDADSGTEVWIHQDKSRFWEVAGGAGPRATPTLSGGRLYAFGAQGLLNCLDPTTGDSIWQRDIRKDADREPPEWGFASSPLVTDGVVIVHAGGAQDNGILAYDTATGDLRWTSPAGDHSYSSPQLSSVDGKPCVLMLTNRGITFVDPANGRLLGRHNWKTMSPRIVQPLLLGGSSVLLGSEMGSGTRRIEVQWNGERFTTKTSWTSRRMQPYFNDYVAHEGHLYGFDNNIFACVDLATGEREWKKGRYGNGQVLLLPSGDQLLVISEYGELVLLRATPDDIVELARHRVLEGRTWNHPVLVGNRVYVRNAEEAACFEVPTR